jgi:hypothetical protein
MPCRVASWLSSLLSQASFFHGAEEKKTACETIYCISDVQFDIAKQKRMSLAGHVECIEEKENAYKILVKKPELKRTLGRPIRRWENNIKIYLKNGV